MNNYSHLYVNIHIFECRTGVKMYLRALQLVLFSLFYTLSERMIDSWVYSLNSVTTAFSHAVIMIPIFPLIYWHRASVTGAFMFMFWMRVPASEQQRRCFNRSRHDAVGHVTIRGSTSGKNAEEEVEGKHTARISYKQTKWRLNRRILETITSLSVSQTKVYVVPAWLTHVTQAERSSAGWFSSRYSLITITTSRS